MKFSAASFRITPAAISALLLVLIGLCVMSYIYFVASSVLNVVMRQDAERAAVASRSDIAMLETKLIAAQHQISSRLAAESGYSRDTQKVFVQRVDSDVAFSGAPAGN